LNRGWLIFKLTLKGGIAAVFLASGFMLAYQMLVGGVKDIIFIRGGGLSEMVPLGSGDLMVMGILTTIVCLIGFSALRGARAVWRELHEPPPENFSIPPGSSWQQPSEEEVALVMASLPPRAVNTFESWSAGGLMCWGTSS
jgi:hypothetical protein